ncbi:MAG TPA: hypothetical protein VH299_13275 [Solirubrobacterales bacterium]|jgi:hypothetical protein|nr:hypothetical protein [Solirubrobacterales bacterium]
MRRSATALACVAIAVAALLVAGCGGGSGSGSSSSTAPGGGGDGGGAGGANGAGSPKKATAPNAPAGSKVVACKEGAADIEQLRAAAVDCGSARETMHQWERSHACTLGKSSSRGSCTLGGFRCQAVRAGRGASVSCARPGGDVSFVAKAWLLRKGGAASDDR